MLINNINIQIICIIKKRSSLSNKVSTKIISLNEGSHTKLIGYKSNCITKFRSLQISKKKYDMYGLQTHYTQI